MEKVKGNIEIRKISLSDIGSLIEIGKQTFIETFADKNSEENMRIYLKEGFNTKKLLEEINNPETIFFFVSANNKDAGYLKLNWGQAQTELKDTRSLEIERIYILKEFQGRGIGQILLNQALDIARQSELDYIWLGVWEKNHQAIQFYKKNGFIEFHKHIFKLGDEEQTDIMMKLDLNER